MSRRGGGTWRKSAVARGGNLLEEISHRGGTWKKSAVAGGDLEEISCGGGTWRKSAVGGGGRKSAGVQCKYKAICLHCLATKSCD